MIALITNWLAGGAGGRLTKLLLVTVISAAVIGLATWRTAAIVNSWIETARLDGQAAEGARWQVELERSNRAVAEAQAQRIAAVAALEAGAGAEIATLREQLTKLETDNASLPGGERCGLDRDRVRLLR